MLVDNDVRRDSRVQKQAVSMAERGWDVTLLGINVTGEPVEGWDVGGARVELVPFIPQRPIRPHAKRPPRLRSPLASRTNARGTTLRVWSQARVSDLVFRSATASTAAGRTWCRVRLVGARAVLAWRTFRSSRNARVAKARRTMAGPIDRFTTHAQIDLRRSSSWSVLDPSLAKWDDAFAPAIAALEPDLIHANDCRMLFVGARATFRARAQGRDTKLVWDAHEFMPGVESDTAHPRMIPALQQLERHYAKYADAVTTVSEPIADLTQRHHRLRDRPVVVLNAPIVSPDQTPAAPSVRERCDLGADIPLVVYSGYVHPQRGVSVVIDALAAILDLHAAFVVSQLDSPALLDLLARAEDLGVRDRVHLLPYVPIEQIVDYLSSATFGTHSLIHMMNHEVSLATKFYEYSQARLPIVGSDVKVMAETIRRTGQGEVFVAGDSDDFVRAARLVLADPDAYRRAYDAPGLLDSWTWEHQAGVLFGVYDRLVPVNTAGVAS